MNKITIKDFTSIKGIVEWKQLKDVLGEREYKKFMKWMFGQTCSPYGVYEWDLDRFLRGLKVID